MADVSIETAKAIEWTRKVQEELDLTNQTLNEVQNVCLSMPGDGDGIIEMISTTGNILQESYQKTSDKFKEAWSMLENGLKDFSTVGDRINDMFDELKRKI